MTDEEVQRLEGRLSAMESMLAQAVWIWASDHDHPPSQLARFLRPLEDYARKIRETAPGPQADMFAETIHDVAEVLQDTLQREALDRATPPQKPS